MESNFSPIIVFAFNRPEALKNTIQSLLQNEEAKESDLYIFVDGARPDKPGEEKKVNAVQEYVKNIKGFKSIHHTFSEVNKGLGNSIIQGVTQVINIYGNAIIVEDDLVCSKNFLSFMNQGLNLFKKEFQIYSICGYTDKVKVPSSYDYDAYICTRSGSWGWGTWKDRWNNIDWELKNWDEVQSHRKGFNKWGGSDCFKMLNDWRTGRNKSWAIRFCFNQYLNNSLSVFPIISKVGNFGFDGSGTNCKKWTRNKFVFDESENKIFKWPTDTTINKKLYKSAMSYNTIWIRIWSRIMYLIYN